MIKYSGPVPNITPRGQKPLELSRENKLLCPIKKDSSS